MVPRRSLLASVATVATVTVAGCSAMASVQDHECGVVFPEGVVCEVVVKNNGPSGDFDVIAKGVENGNTVDEERERVRLDFRERRTVEMSVSSVDGASIEFEVVRA